MAVRIGFIGTGGIAQMHMRNLQRIEQANVVGMFDVAEDRAQAAAAMFPGSKVYPSYQALLEQADLDAVYVCPPLSHERQEIDAAAAGISSSYSLASPWTSGDQQASPAGHRRVLAGGGWTSLTARDILKDTRSPWPRLLVGRNAGVPWWRHRTSPADRSWANHPHLRPGPLLWARSGGSTRLGSGNHDRYRELQHRGRQQRHLFASGTVATITSTDLLPYGAGKIGLDLIGRDIRLEHANRTLTVYRRGERTTYDAMVDPYLVEDETFVQAVASGDPSRLRSTYADALKTHLVTMTANRPWRRSTSGARRLARARKGTRGAMPKPDKISPCVSWISASLTRPPSISPSTTRSRLPGSEGSRCRRS